MKFTKATKKKTSDAVEILHRRYYEGRPEQLAMLEEERVKAELARQIYELRTNAGMSQRDLGKLVDTTASVICRLEDADYDGPSLAMLRRIAEALDQRVEIRFVPLGRQAKRAKIPAKKNQRPWKGAQRATRFKD